MTLRKCILIIVIFFSITEALFGKYKNISKSDIKEEIYKLYKHNFDEKLIKIRDNNYEVKTKKRAIEYKNNLLKSGKIIANNNEKNLQTLLILNMIKLRKTYELYYSKGINIINNNKKILPMILEDIKEAKKIKLTKLDWYDYLKAVRFLGYAFTLEYMSHSYCVKKLFTIELANGTYEDERVRKAEFIATSFYIHKILDKYDINNIEKQIAEEEKKFTDQYPEIK